MPTWDSKSVICNTRNVAIFYVTKSVTRKSYGKTNVEEGGNKLSSINATFYSNVHHKDEWICHISNT